MNERDRMLAEGPRVAPEPPTADGFAPIAPVDSTQQPAPPRPASRNRGWNVPLGARRLIPLGLFAVIFATNAGAGRYAIWAIAAIAVGATLIRLARKATK